MKFRRPATLAWPYVVNPYRAAVACDPLGGSSDNASAFAAQPVAIVEIH